MALVEPDSFEFQLFFVMTLAILITKVVLAVYIGRNIYLKKKSKSTIGLDFMYAMFFLLISLFISRIFFSYFDFVLTKFDADTYYIYPNYWWWKTGMIISAAGIAYVLFIVDKKILNFKLKGILAIITIVGAVVIFIYPVNNSADFAFISGLSIITNGAIAILLVLFIYIAIKTPGLRKVCLFIVTGGILYAVGSVLVNEALLTQLRAIYGQGIHVFVFFVFMTLKISGLILMSYGFTKFSI